MNARDVLAWFGFRESKREEKARDRETRRLEAALHRAESDVARYKAEADRAGKESREWADQAHDLGKQLELAADALDKREQELATLCHVAQAFLPEFDGKRRVAATDEQILLASVLRQVDPRPGETEA